MPGLQSDFWPLEVVWTAAAISATLVAVLRRVAPQLAAKLLAPCDLQRADYVLVKVMLFM